MWEGGLEFTYFLMNFAHAFSYQKLDDWIITMYMAYSFVSKTEWRPPQWKFYISANKCVKLYCMTAKGSSLSTQLLTDENP